MTVTATRNFILLSQSLTINKKNGQPGVGLLVVLTLYKPGGRSVVSGVETTAASAPGCAGMLPRHRGGPRFTAHRRTMLSLVHLRERCSQSTAAALQPILSDCKAMKFFPMCSHPIHVQYKDTCLRQTLKTCRFLSSQCLLVHDSTELAICLHCVYLEELLVYILK